ncbi:MAG TPA: hypothetical protein VEI48_03070 [Candidatus Sulfotelmatobacter sp.]|nr:hypothetical protein [Candidatus Sulfotelmatobacter sp.]
MLLAPFPNQCTIIPRVSPVTVDGIGYHQVVLTIDSTGQRHPGDVAFGAKDGYGVGATAHTTGVSGATQQAALQAQLQRLVDAVLAGLP